MRRISPVCLLAVAAVAIGLMSMTAPAFASTAKNGSGSLKCNMTGSVGFTPALTTTPASVTVKVAGTLATCTGSGDGANVTGGKFNGTITASSMSCNAGTYSTTGTLRSSYTVKTGTSALNPSTISFVTIQIISNVKPVSAQVNGAPTAGSFVPDGEFGNITANQTTACAARWRFTGTPTASTFELG